ncbi:hypothetical protein ACI65C_006033 [Semiaphis heraclei]
MTLTDGPKSRYHRIIDLQTRSRFGGASIVEQAGHLPTQFQAWAAKIGNDDVDGDVWNERHRGKKKKRERRTSATRSYSPGIRGRYPIAETSVGGHTSMCRAWESVAHVMPSSSNAVHRSYLSCRHRIRAAALTID